MLTGFTSSVHYFRQEKNLKLQFLPYNSPFFYFAFDNELKADKANPALLNHKYKPEPHELKLHEVKSTDPHELKLHEVKSTDMQCILTTNINKCRGIKATRRKKMPDLRLGNVFQLPSRRISRRWTRSGTNLVSF